MFKKFKYVILFISLFYLFSLNVYAYTFDMDDLKTKPSGYCIYVVTEDGDNPLSFMIKQDIQGNYDYYFYEGESRTDFLKLSDDSKWKKDGKGDYFSFSNSEKHPFFDDDNDYYTSCPKYVQIPNYLSIGRSFSVLYINEKPNTNIYTEVSSDSSLGLKTYRQGESSGYGEICPNESSLTWLEQPNESSEDNVSCLYYSNTALWGCYLIQINLKEGASSITSSDVRANFFKWNIEPFSSQNKLIIDEEFSKTALENMKCPPILGAGPSILNESGKYSLISDGFAIYKDYGGYKIYNSKSDKTLGPTSEEMQRVETYFYLLSSAKLIKSSPESSKIIAGETIINYENCEELIGTKMQELLKNVVKILRILIPILLNVFGIIDFAKAIFAGDEEAMKKAQAKFIKRLIIGVIIYLIPTILKLVLNIAHGIWPVVDNTVCGILD